MAAPGSYGGRVDSAQLADRILRARAEADGCLVASDLPITDAQAYEVQAILTQARLDRGEVVVGWKLGYTSAAMRAQMGIDHPNVGPLTDAMLVPDGGRLPAARQPRVEPEIALVMGPDGVAEARLALEVVDSIWCDYRFTWAHNTADGSSAAYVVLGCGLPLTGLAETTVELLRNGEVVGRGSGDAAMGDPLAALAWLEAQLANRGERLRAGDVVITGGLCAAVPFVPGDVIEAKAGSAWARVSRS